MEQITTLMEELPVFQDFFKAFRRGDSPLSFTGTEYIHRAFIIASVIQSIRRPVVVISPDDAAAARMQAELQNLLSGEVLLLPFRDFVFHPMEGASREYEHKRIRTLSRWNEGLPLVVSGQALTQFSIPPAVLAQASFSIERGKRYSLAALTERLLSIGYTRCMQVEGYGQFSLRGGILDLYPPQASAPARIEFWDEDVDTISLFDIGSQRRGAALDRVICLPVSEALPALGGDTLAMRIRQAADALPQTARDDRAVLLRDAERLEGGMLFPSLDKYLPYLYGGLFTAADYIPQDAVVFLDRASAVRENTLGFERRLREDLVALTERHFPVPEIPYCLCFAALCKKLEQNRIILLDDFLARLPELPSKGLFHLSAKELPPFGGSLLSITEEVQAYLSQNYRVILLCSGDAKCSMALDMLAESIPQCSLSKNMPQPGHMAIMTGSLGAGFELPEIRLAVFSEGKPVSRRKSRSVKQSNREKIKHYTDLVPGDIVVHEHHGIGRFSGIERIAVDGTEKDYVKIAFSGTDCLYVPTTNLDLISKYIGAGEEGSVRLNKLGGADWQKTKARAKASAKELAAKLIALYAQREKTPGFAFPEDDSWQEEFEDAFAYDETEDQIRCSEEIKQDMMRPRPMDRLLCGDVGFGKTEVALRAVMKCVLGNKQAAILVPTTVLARQHYLTASARFSGYPIKIELLSRYRTAKEQEAIYQKLREGGIDLIIGTHKLLSKKLRFRDLGLLIIDEEQRFGVSHKETLKELSRSVDVLTLSATPIPRTLNMALSGIRDMSMIEEPPADRHPVQTYVLEYDLGILTDALRRELSRGGQAYYLHNRVEDMETIVRRLRDKLPSAVIEAAHGKMNQKTLADIMTRMSAGEIDVLVCTTIIETGVDIPNVNTLIIEDADKMGLAQLHQIRGRVGRSSRHAFAYLTFRRGKVLTEVAKKRLSAVREFAEFGSGFKIAMRDLEIRGAGNVLGPEQSGHLMSIGYDLYLKLLEDAVLEEQGRTPKTRTECSAELTVSANIPSSYVPDDGQRIDLYRRIALIQTEADKSDMLDELIDRFGEPPQSVAALCDIALLRAIAGGCGIIEIRQQDHRLFLKWQMPDFAKLSALCGDPAYKGRLLLNAGSDPYLSLRLLPEEAVLPALFRLLRAYSALSSR